MQMWSFNSTHAIDVYQEIVIFHPSRPPKGNEKAFYFLFFAALAGATPSCRLTMRSLWVYFFNSDE